MTTLTEPQAQYQHRVSRLVELARTGNREAYMALVHRDEDGQPLDFAPIHRVMLRFIDHCWAREYYAGILAVWRHGKSEIGKAVALQEIGLNPNTRVKMICAADEEAIERVTSARRYIQSPEYQWVFPSIRPADDANWTMHKFYVQRTSPGQDPTLSAANVLKGEAGSGADIIILDDIVTLKNSVHEPTTRPKIYQALTSVWLRRINPQTRVLLIGTTWHHDDAYQQIMRSNNGQWLFLIIGVSQDFKRLDCRVVG